MVSGLSCQLGHLPVRFLRLGTLLEVAYSLALVKMERAVKESMGKSAVHRGDLFDPDSI